MLVFTPINKYSCKIAFVFFTTLFSYSIRQRTWSHLNPPASTSLSDRRTFGLCAISEIQLLITLINFFADYFAARIGSSIAAKSKVNTFLHYFNFLFLTFFQQRFVEKLFFVFYKFIVFYKFWNFWTFRGLLRYCSQWRAFWTFWTFKLYINSFGVENKGLEPLTLCVQGRCSKPTELIPRF